MAEKYPNVSSYVYCHDNPVKYLDLDGNDLVYFNSVGAEVKRVISSTQFRTFVDIKGTYAEAPMPKIIRGYETPAYQKYDYNIAAQTFIFNELADDELPKTSGGKSLTGARPSDLDPTLVKAIIVEETGAGTINGAYGQNGKMDIMQANVTTTSGQTDWNDCKKDYGLTKGGSATPNQSVYAGIRILFTKGLKTETIKDKMGNIIDYNVTWRGVDWSNAIKRYNGGGNPNYLQEVLKYYQNAISSNSNNYTTTSK